MSRFSKSPKVPITLVAALLLGCVLAFTAAYDSWRDYRGFVRATLETEQAAR